MNSVQEKLNYLKEMAEKYRLLNERANNEYQWRLDAINEKIEVLEDILDGVTNEYDECYEEDLIESDM